MPIAVAFDRDRVLERSDVVESERAVFGHRLGAGNVDFDLIVVVIVIAVGNEITVSAIK